MTEIKGIDVSYAQGNVDWEEVKRAGIEFVMIRAGYGREISQKDSLFESHYAGAKKAGLKVGAYWYSYAKDVDGARKEAETCLKVIAGKQFDYPVVYDLEDPTQRKLSKDTLSDMAVAFLDAVERAGYFAMLYANLDWLRNKLDYNKIKRFSIWLAQWREGGHTYEHDLGMWQYTSSGKVPGISGRVDMDIAYKDFAAIINGTDSKPSTPSTGYPEPTRTLRRGDSGTDVKWLQSSLLVNGIPVGAAGIDGEYGADTERAVKTAQRLAGITVDGLAGKDTVAALKRGIKCPYARPTSNICKGSKGDGTRWVQWHLVRLGYDIGTAGIDGDCGTATCAAIERFQRDVGLTVDGIAGKNTTKKLEEK